MLKNSKNTISILGCGWLGHPLAKFLIGKKFNVKGSTTSTSKIKSFENDGISPYIFTLENLKPNLSEFLESEILIVALPSKKIEGFKNLITEIEKSSIKKVIFISSTSVYPSINSEVTEEMDLPTSPLLEIEQLFITNKNFKTTIVRFSGLFGYDRKPGNFFKDGRIIPNPQGFVNMIHQDDCISILYLIVKNNFWGEIFNACADTHPTRCDFYNKTKRDIGLDPPIFENGKEIETYKIVSNKKVKNLLHFTFKYNDLLNINYGSLNV